MAKHSSSVKKKNNGTSKLNLIVKNLQKNLQLGKKLSSFYGECDDARSNNNVPEDVKEGHFAVIATEAGEEPRRFVVPLCYLGHPTFVRLLELAAEEYGFAREGALTIPCRPSELERILAEDVKDST